MNSAAPSDRVARPIDLLVIHCAATPNGRRITVEDIDTWHRGAGFARSPQGLAKMNPGLAAIGYHWVIYANGALVTGRHASESGAHARGYNHRSLGLALVGTDRYSPAQWQQLADQVGFLCDRYGIPRRVATRDNAFTGVCGHRDLPDVAKACPGFSVTDWVAGGLKPVAGHVLEIA